MLSPVTATTIKSDWKGITLTPTRSPTHLDDKRLMIHCVTCNFVVFVIISYFHIRRLMVHTVTVEILILVEKLNPQDDPESRRQFLTNFDWTDSMLQPAEIARIEHLLVEFHDIFARHRFDIGAIKHRELSDDENDDMEVEIESPRG